MASTSLPHSEGAPPSSQPKVKPVSTAADSSGAAALRAAEAEAQAARAHDEAERQRARAEAARAEAEVAKVARAREEAERQQARAEAAKAEAEAERQKAQAEASKAQAEASSLEARQAMLEARALRVELNRFKASLATHKQAEPTAMADADERATGGRAAVIGTARPSPNAPGRKPINPIAGINAGATAAAIAACTQARVKVAETPLVSPGATGLTAPPGMDSPSTAPRPVQRRAPTSSSKSKPRLSSGKGTKGATIVDVAQI